MKEDIGQQAIAALEGIVGASRLLTDPESIEHYGQDWTKTGPVEALAVALPSDTDQVSKILKYCSDQEYAVVPSGGRTGLAGGAMACKGEVILSLERMNKILRFDPIGATITVEAGVTTQAVQEAAAEHGLFFGLDLASKGSSQIGGNIATNAGGTKLIKYGGMREQVLGIEAVLPSGEILDLNTSLRKNNVGYDLKQLFIGSEGTLGIVTKATLKLMPAPKNLRAMLMAVPDFSKVTELFSMCSKHHLAPTAFEFFSDQALAVVLKHNSSLKAPFATDAKYYVLLEVEDHGSAEEAMGCYCEAAMEASLIEDAVISYSSDDFNSIWSLRENISESLATDGRVAKNDIALAICDLAGYLEEILALTNQNADINIVLFGHIGDGNIHINYTAPFDLSEEQFKGQVKDLEEKYFSILKKYRGSISAEHGIGILKKPQLPISCTQLQIDLMRQIKKCIDPKGIMNPGKIFDSKI